MVASTFKEAFPEGWVKEHIKDSSNELVILRQVFPWQKVIEQLIGFYCEGKGRNGKSLRVMVALQIIGKLRHLK